MPVPTIEQQTGWKRPFPHQLLQGFPDAGDILQRIGHYDFDLDDPAFRFYCEQRGVLWYAGKEGGWRWNNLRCAGWGQMPADDLTQGERYAAGRLQDCAELFRTDLSLTADIMRLWVPPPGVPPWRRPLIDPAGDFVMTPAGSLTHADMAQDVTALEAMIAPPAAYDGLPSVQQMIDATEAPPLNTIVPAPVGPIGRALLASLDVFLRQEQSAAERAAGQPFFHSDGQADLFGF